MDSTETTWHLILSEKVYKLEISPTKNSRAFNRDLIDFSVEAHNPLDARDRWTTLIGMSLELSEDYPGFNLKIPIRWLLLRFLYHHVCTNSIHILDGPHGEVLKTTDFEDYIGKRINNNQAEEILRTLLLSWVRTFAEEEVELRNLFISTDLSIDTLQMAINSLIFQGHLEKGSNDSYLIKSSILHGIRHVDRNVTQTDDFEKWAGGDHVTLAIVFTDVVGSTALGQELGGELMEKVRQAHFEQTRRLLRKYQGWEIKTIGDSFMVAFHNVANALDFAIELQSNTGHTQIKIRVGIHIGPLQITGNDAYGDTVNFTSRIISSMEGAEVWMSDRAKEDIDLLRADRHHNLKWERLA